MQTDLHFISDHPEQAQRTADRALRWLHENKGSPCPVQYAVSYVHLSELNNDLSRALSKRLQEQTPLPDRGWQELFDEFIVANPATLPAGMGEAIKSLLEAAEAQMSQASQDTEIFGMEVKEAVSGLTTGDKLTSEALLGLGQRLLTASMQARERAEATRIRMQEALTDVDKLRSQLDEQRHAASHDSLTGLLNRRGMQAHFTSVLQAGTSSGMAVLMIDIDHFKAFNDKFGHSVGDAVIRNVAQVIRSSIRPKDAAVRYGGEEFAVIMPDTSRREAQTLAEHVCSKVASLRLKRRSDSVTLPPVTVSVGVAMLQPGEDADYLLQRADLALYASKRDGRNRVTTSEK